MKVKVILQGMKFELIDMGLQYPSSSKDTSLVWTAMYDEQLMLIWLTTPVK